MLSLKHRKSSFKGSRAKRAFVQWLRLKGYPFGYRMKRASHYWSQKLKIRARREFWRSDLFVAVPFPPPSEMSPIKTVTMRFGTKNFRPPSKMKTAEKEA